MPIVFFDIGDTLATPVLSPDNRLLGFNVFPEARQALESLAAKNIRMGVISNAGDEEPARVNELLDQCGLLRFFDRSLIIYGKKDSPAIFVSAAGQANVPPDQCVFVGENSKERALALAAGFLRVSPHPLLTLDVLDGIALVYGRVKLSTAEQAARWSEIRQSIQLVPLKVTGNAPQIIYLITTIKAFDALRSAQIEVEVLGDRDKPLLSDLYLARDDRPVSQGFAVAAERSASYLAEENLSDFLVSHSPEGQLLAVPADRSIEEVHFPGARHGHNEKLIADASLLNPPAAASFSSEPSALLATAAVALSDEEVAKLSEITGEALIQFHQPYTGLAPLGDGASVVSRHVKHADNGRVVETLLRHFEEIGGPDVVVGRHRFQHENLLLHNVVAEFPGTEPESLVLVTAHLDSTAASSSPYNAAHDPAPGADDDASGVAAVLMIAKVLAGLRATRRTKRTIRFVLFNAEEDGLVGSKAYARGMAAQGADIAAVFQMDMIGYRGAHSAPPRNYEVHAGYPPSPDVEARSLALAQFIQGVAGTVAPNLNPPQIYPDRKSGADDLAAGRSDHASFQERGYAACVLSEDFFAGPRDDSPDAEPNPNYHKRTDREIDYDYAADIARVVAAAALMAANQ